MNWRPDMHILRFSPAVRITLGVVALTLSLLVVADLLGIIPDNKNEALKQRQHYAEMVSLQMSVAVRQKSSVALQSLLWSVVQRNDQIVGAAVRRNDGALLAGYGDHNKVWDPQLKNTEEHMRLPILDGDRNYGIVELNFRPLTVGKQLLGISLIGLNALLVFILLFGSVGYWIFLRRTLTYLDPSAVVPARVRSALNVLSNGVLIIDDKERVVLANASFANKLGTSPDSLFGKKPSTLPWEIPSKHGKRFKFPWLTTLSDGTEMKGVSLNLKGINGDTYEFRANSAPIIDNDGKQRGVIVSLDDVTALETKNRLLENAVEALEIAKQQVELQNIKLHIMATRDPLTNCHNRRSLYDTLESTLAKAKEHKTQLSCIMTDIDHFKSVNDEYGHAKGDEIIKMVANVLIDALGDEGIVCRYGGEEFCIMLPGKGIFDAKTIAERCRSKIESQITSGVRVTSSFGVSTLRFGAKTVDELIHQADEALYVSKNNGRNRVSCWENEKPLSNMTINTRAV